jgi:hypothetical protein
MNRMAMSTQWILTTDRAHQCQSSLLMSHATQCPMSLRLTDLLHCCFYGHLILLTYLNNKFNFKVPSHIRYIRYWQTVLIHVPNYLL